MKIRKMKILVYCVILFIVVFSLSLLAFWIEHNSSLTLPKPTGTFAVGRENFHWIDSSRVDYLAPNPNTKRELNVWIWYPASKNDSSKLNDYLPTNWRNAIARHHGFFISNFLVHDLSKVYPNSFKNAHLPKNKLGFPVIILKSGIGMLATDYTTIAEDLASHGFIVVGSDAPYSTFIVVFNDGRIINKTPIGNPGDFGYTSEYQTKLLNNLLSVWISDTKFILSKLEELNSKDTTNQFFSQINLQSIGIVGHSFGGAVAAQICSEDPRFKAGIDIDGAPYGKVIHDGIEKPFMFLLADHTDETDSMSLQIKSNIKTICKSLPASHLLLTLKGANHFNFSDMAIVRERILFRLFGATGSIGNSRGLQVTSDCLKTYFNVHLKGYDDALLTKLIRENPEIMLEEQN